MSLWPKANEANLPGARASPALSPADANRLFYATEAERYDQTEYCVRASGAVEQLRDLLQIGIRDLPRNARVLDAGGGSGNASSLLVGWGFDPLVVDVSPEMLSIWGRKARAFGVTPRVELSSVEEFFSADQRHWDLVVFSSVLHHLKDPVQTLQMAAQRLSPGGRIVTMFDPRRAGMTGKALRRLDYLLWVARHDPRRLVTIGRRLIRPPARNSETGEVLGRLAEIHAVTGLDDTAISLALRVNGCEAVVHARSFQARHRIVRLLARASRTPTGFAFVFRRSE